MTLTESYLEPLIPRDDNEKVTLKKSINLASGCAIIVGTIVGSGVFISSKGVLENAGTPALSICVWLFSGLISLVGAICFTELGTLITSSGGNYAYIKETYGNFLAFLYIWMMVFVCVPCMNAVAALTISMYLVRLFTNDCTSLFLVTRIIAALVLCLLGYINTFDVRFISKIQMTFTIAKLTALFIVISTAFWTFYEKSNEKTSQLTGWLYSDKPNDYSKIALSLYNSLFSYSGW
jgi:amino acid transporter